MNIALPQRLPKCLKALAPQNADELAPITPLEIVTGFMFLYMFVFGLYLETNPENNAFLRHHLENFADIPVWSYGLGGLVAYFTFAVPKYKPWLARVFNFENRVIAITLLGLGFEFYTAFTTHQHFDYIDAGIYTCMGLLYGVIISKINKALSQPS